MTVAEMSPEQKLDALFYFICLYKAEHDGNSPTRRECVNATLYCSVSHVSDALSKLEKRGLIRLAGKGRARNIEVVGGRWSPPNETPFEEYSHLALRALEYEYPHLWDLILTGEPRSLAEAARLYAISPYPAADVIVMACNFELSSRLEKAQK